MATKKTTKNNDNAKSKKLLKTKKKLDNSVEVEIQKSPSETVSGKVLIVLIVAGTILLPLAIAIWYIISIM